MDSAVLSSLKPDLHRSITEKIIKAVEAGAGEYRMPWHHDGGARSRPINAASAKLYRGVNVVTLWCEAARRRYRSSYWATYRQWRDLGAQVQKGEKGALIVFYKKVEAPPAADEKEEAKDHRKFVARASFVFNADQIDGCYLPPPPARNLVTALEGADSFICAIKADIRHGCPMACYQPAGDYIEMPAREHFIGTPTSTPTESYYSTLLHELIHLSGAAHRLNRDLSTRFGDQAYAMEELVAELGAAFLCAELGIANDPRPDHAAYLAHWLRVFDRDAKALITAASKAAVAADYLTRLASTGEMREATDGSR
ncbi:MAG TPA: zincin-like metallopeptidase domain-containing protein [Candidatus Cybelea sp.]|nr:zincin-like metallopeptidase domain-containing protein [Candidatus Cybelea sp.]